MIALMAPDDYRTSLERARALIQAGDPHPARELLGQLTAARPDDPQAWHFLGIAHNLGGDSATAERCFRESIAAGSRSPHTFYNLGAVLLHNGRMEDAVEQLRRAIQLNESFVEAYVALGHAQVRRRQLPDALVAYQHALRLQPESAELHDHTGFAHAELGQGDAAERAYRRAIELNPALARAHHHLGALVHGQGRLTEAVQCYEQAITLEPRYAQAVANLGKALLDQRALDRALVCLERAVALDAGDAETWNLLGVAHALRGDPAAAVGCYREALRRAPNLAAALNNLGTALARLGKASEAMDALRRAAAADDRQADAYINLGDLLRAQGRLAEAASEYESALDRAPNSARAHESLGDTHGRQGRLDEALQRYARAQELAPADRVRVKMAMLLPPIPRSLEDMLAWRRRFEAGVAQLGSESLRLEDPVTEINGTNFYLSYHGVDNRALQTQVARLFEQACPSLGWTAPHCQRWGGPSGRIRVGFISHYLRNHSIGRTTRGLVAKLSRERFEVYTLFVPPVRDDETAHFIRAHSDRSLTLPDDLAAARRAIADLELDVLFYQDIGMEPFTYFLAFARLAPVQCVSFGHPDTTGIRNMDYWVSSDLFEPSGAESQYSERLFLLRDVGTLAYYYRPQPSSAKPRAAFGLPANTHVYLCPQTLFKFHPEFDQLLAGILRRDAQGLVVLLDAKVPEWTELLRQRYDRSIADVSSRIRFLPTVTSADFLSLIAASDVMLDTVHFNGMNTSLEAFSLGTPVVTWPSNLQRGRHTSGMYAKMGLDDCIARSLEDYVAIAVRLACEPGLRLAIGNKIRAASHALFEDSNVVREFERFFVHAVAQAQPSPTP